MKKHIIFITGIILTTIGIIGIVLPILPTTPFLLLASYCFIRTSEKAYTWLLNNKICGSYIKNYALGCGVTKKEKRRAFIVLTISIIISQFFISSLTIKAVLFIFYVGVSIHIFLMKTKPLNFEIKPNK